MRSDIIIYIHRLTCTHKEKGMLKLTDGVCVCQVLCMENCNEYDYDLKAGVVYIMSKTKAVTAVVFQVSRPVQTRINKSFLSQPSTLAVFCCCFSKLQFPKCNSLFYISFILKFGLKILHCMR